jgi:RNA polymerase sigma-70 factor (ECF subfamily)
MLPTRTVANMPHGMVPISNASQEAWFDDFYRQQQPAVFAYARSLVRDEETARDIVQDTFLSLWKDRPDPTFARAWVFRVCRTRAIDWWRKKRALPASDFGVEGENTSDFFERLPDETAIQPNDSLANKEATSALMLEVEQLPKRQRELVRLKFQVGLSYREIADTAGLSVTNVGFILHTALAALRKRLTAPTHNH